MCYRKINFRRGRGGRRWRERDWLGGRMAEEREGGKMKVEKGCIY